MEEMIFNEVHCKITWRPSSFSIGSLAEPLVAIGQLF
jgi:hypothetical protein